MGKLFDRSNEKKFMIGIELRGDTCQLSYGWEKGGRFLQEPETYSEVPDAERFDQPMCLCWVPSAGQWFHGSEAALHAADPGCVYIPGLMALAMENVPIPVGEKTWEARALLALYLGRCLGAVRDRVRDAAADEKLPDEPSAVMFTMRRMDAGTIDLLEDIRRRMDLRAKVCYQSLAGTFYDFMLSQEASLREGAAALLEYEAGGKLRVSRLIFNPHTRPVVSYMEEKEYPGLPGETDAERDRAFAGILKEELGGHRFASVYLTGSGFAGSWMKRSSMLLCRGRRAFVGENLFSKGAVYGAMYRLEQPQVLKEYFFLDQNKLRTNVLIRALNRGKEDRIPAVDAGQNWYEVQEETELILDGTAQLDFVLKPITGGKELPYHIRLDRLPVREGRMTRIRLSFSMTAPDKMQVRMEDLGFGEIFPSSGLVWEQTMTL